MAARASSSRPLKSTRHHGACSAHSRPTTSNRGFGEFIEIDAPRKLVLTREFEKHPLLGSRETTISFRFEAVDDGTRITVRDEGFIGRSEAAYGKAEHWERVLGWLSSYLMEERNHKDDLGAMPTAVFGTHASVRVSQNDRENLRSFYRDVFSAAQRRCGSKSNPTTSMNCGEKSSTTWTRDDRTSPARLSGSCPLGCECGSAGITCIIERNTH